MIFRKTEHATQSQLDLDTRLDPFVVSSEKHAAFAEVLHMRWARMADKSKLHTPIMDTCLEAERIEADSVSTFKLSPRQVSPTNLQPVVYEGPGYTYWQSGVTDAIQWPTSYQQPTAPHIREKYTFFGPRSPYSTIPSHREIEVVAQPAEPTAELTVTSMPMVPSVPLSFVSLMGILEGKISFAEAREV